MGLLEGLQVLLARQDNLLLVLVPVALELTDVLLPLLEEFVHLDVVLGQDRASLFIVLLVAQLFNLRLRFLGVEKLAFKDTLLTEGFHLGNHLLVVVVLVSVVHHFLLLFHVVLDAIHLELVLLGVDCAHLGVLLLHCCIFVCVSLSWLLVF